MSLFKLPCVTQTERLTPRIAAMSSLTVVLPLLPVTATTGIGERRTPRARHGTERAARVAHLDLRQRRRGEPRHERAGGALRERFLDEVVAVEPIARNRDEQRARRRARACPSSRRRTTDRRRRGGPAPRARPRPAFAPSWRHSEELGDDGAVAERAPLGADELLRFVTFARDEHDVARPRALDRGLQRGAAVVNAR